MASSFKGEDVFGSGPHEFFVGRVGRRRWRGIRRWRGRGSLVILSCG